MFDYRQLQCFVTVAHEGQMTRAAAKLHVAQPALSQTIAKLEAVVGVQLLERHPRGVSLTAAGEAFLEKARAALSAAEEARAVLGPWLREDRALALGCLPSTQPIARPIVRQFTQALPGVDMQVRELGVSERLNELKNGEIDVELLYPPPRDPDLWTETVAYAPRYVLLADSHPLASESRLVFEQIAGETFPGRHPSVPEKWAEEAWLSRYRGRVPPVTSETPLTLEEVWTLVCAEKAIVVLPDFMVPSTEGDGVRAIPLVDVEPIEVALARRRTDTRTIVSALFDIARGLSIETRPHPIESEAPSAGDRQ